MTECWIFEAIQITNDVTRRKKITTAIIYCLRLFFCLNSWEVQSLNRTIDVFNVVSWSESLIKMASPKNEQRIASKIKIKRIDRAVGKNLS